MSGELWRRSAADLAALIASGEVSSREVVDAHLERIEAVNPHLNALAVVLAMVAAGCGNKADTSGGGGGQAANWPQRDLRIMAPADPGGGWDTTARVMSQAMTQSKAVDKGMVIGAIRLIKKTGGKSGTYRARGSRG